MILKTPLLNLAQDSPLDLALILRTPLQNLAQDTPLDLALILKTPLQDLAKDSSLALNQMMTILDLDMIWAPFQDLVQVLVNSLDLTLTVLLDFTGLT